MRSGSKRCDRGGRLSRHISHEEFTNWRGLFFFELQRKRGCRPHPNRSINPLVPFHLFQSLMTWSRSWWVTWFKWVMSLLFLLGLIEECSLDSFDLSRASLGHYSWRECTKGTLGSRPYEGRALGSDCCRGYCSCWCCYYYCSCWDYCCCSFWCCLGYGARGYWPLIISIQQTMFSV